MGGGNNTGMRAAGGRYWLLLNSDAWAREGRARRARRVRRRPSARGRRRAAAVQPGRLAAALGARRPDALAARDRVPLPAQARPAHRRSSTRSTAAASPTTSPREVESLLGAALLVRREAADEVGLFDEAFFMFSEETDWLYRFRQAGWQVWFTPTAEVVHLGGASHGGRLYVENLRGILRFLAKNRGRARGRAGAAAAALVAPPAVARSSAASAGARYRDGVRFLASGDVPARCSRDLRVPAAGASRPGSCCCPGSSSRGRSGSAALSPTLAWTFGAPVPRLGGGVRAPPHDLARASRADGIGLVGRGRARRPARPAAGPRRDAAGGAPVGARLRCSAAASVLGLAALARRGRRHRRRALPRGARPQARRARRTCTCARSTSSPAAACIPGYAFPLWHGFLALIAKVSGLDPSVVVHREASLLVPLACVVAWEAGVAVFRSATGGIGVLAASRRRSSASPRGTAARTSRSRLPATSSRQLLVPVVFALFFTYLRRRSAGRRRRARGGASARSRSCTRPTRSSR